MGFLSKILKGFSFAMSIIIGIEPLFGAGSGDQKKNAALGLISTIMGVAEGIAGKDIVDEKGFNEGVSQMIDGAVKCLNASLWHKK